MAKIIIGIHGLGNKPRRDLLEKWWRLSIYEGLRNNKKYFFKPKFEIIYWADILHDKPEDESITDKNDPLYLGEKYTPASANYSPKDHSARKKVLDFLEKQFDKLFLNKDLTINFSFISDLIIHEYFRDLEIYYNGASGLTDKNIPAREAIRRRTADILKKHAGDEIFFVTHSMGTIVAYDVLTLLIPEIKIDTLVTAGSPLGIPVVMGKIAAEQKLSKSKLTTPANITRKWLNYSDLEDKVAFNYNLNDDYGPNEKGIAVSDFLVENNYIINGKRNPHKIYGYLRTPEFSEALYGFIMQGRSAFVRRMIELTNNIYGRMVAGLLGKLKPAVAYLSGEDYEP